MNAQRRKEIKKVLEMLADASMEIEAIKSDEEDSFESIPESLHGTENHENSERAVLNLGEAEANIMECAEQLESAIE